MFRILCKRQKKKYSVDNLISTLVRNSWWYRAGTTCSSWIPDPMPKIYLTTNFFFKKKKVLKKNLFYAYSTQSHSSPLFSFSFTTILSLAHLNRLSPFFFPTLNWNNFSEALRLRPSYNIIVLNYRQTIFFIILLLPNQRPKASRQLCLVSKRLGFQMWVLIHPIDHVSSSSFDLSMCNQYH